MSPVFMNTVKLAVPNGEPVLWSTLLALSGKKSIPWTAQSPEHIYTVSGLEGKAQRDKRQRLLNQTSAFRSRCPKWSGALRSVPLKIRDIRAVWVVWLICLWLPRAYGADVGAVSRTQKFLAKTYTTLFLLHSMPISTSSNGEDLVNALRQHSLFFLSYFLLSAEKIILIILYSGKQ